MVSLRPDASCFVTQKGFYSPQSLFEVLRKEFFQLLDGVVRDDGYFLKAPAFRKYDPPPPNLPHSGEES
ncbi:MAG: hypothetical protein PHD61_04770 [Bacteroidales bacterium]|nr:hypothetical protein [Bacteroidales bacterium]